MGMSISPVKDNLVRNGLVRVLLLEMLTMEEIVNYMEILRQLR